MAVVTIELSPFEPNLGTAGNLTLSVMPPYSDDGLVLLVNPNVTDYEEGDVEQTSTGKNDVDEEDADAPGVIVAQTMTTESSEHSRQLAFDFKQRNVHFIRVAGKSYQIKLLAIRKKPINGQEFFQFDFEVDETNIEPTGIQKEGSITFWCKHEHKDWWKNEHGYNFGPFVHEVVAVQVVKNPDKTVDIKVQGPLGEVFTSKQTMPECTEKGLFVAITWSHDTVRFYLNANEVDVQHPGE